MQKVFVAIDAGNTNIAFGFFRGGRIVRKAALPADAYSFPRMKKIFSNTPTYDVIIASVVPSLTRILARDCQRISGKRPYVLGKDVRVPIKNHYRQPSSLGRDRLVGAWAGLKMFGSPLIVIDFGTAITVDIVSKSKEYLGGMILPGMRIALAALHENTALLPRIALNKPAEFIGRDTRSSMLSGVVHGFAALTEGLVKKIKARIGEGALVIGTGGDIALMNKYCAAFDATDADLILKGLFLLYKQECFSKDRGNTLKTAGGLNV